MPTSSPWDRSGSPAPVCRRVVWGCTPSVRGCGGLPLCFWGQFELSLHSWRAPREHSWKNQPCAAGPPSHPCTAGEASLAQLKDHLGTSAAPGTAGTAMQGTAGQVTPAQLAHVGLPRTSLRSTPRPVGPEWGGRGLRAALAVFHSGGLIRVSTFTRGTAGPGLICMRGPGGRRGYAEGCNCLGCAQNISCASQIFTQGKTKS